MRTRSRLKDWLHEEIVIINLGKPLEKAILKDIVKGYTLNFITHFYNVARVDIYMMIGVSELKNHLSSLAH
jgi:hypothetical protein